MNHEYEVLSHLQENELTTQRKISMRTGLSLGAVNLLLKKMARKGLVKIEKLNARTMRYILTPKGMQEKSHLAYSYIRHSYQQILRINSALEAILAAQAEETDNTPIILCGPADEIREILTQALRHNNRKFALTSNAKSLGSLGEGDGQLVITWREEEESDLGECINATNIMKML